MKTGDIIEVVWSDAWSNTNGRYDPAYKYGPITMVDIGHFVHENDEGLLMARTCQSGTIYQGETFLPWNMIVSIEVLV